MTRPLRQLHRRIFFGIGLVFPLAFVAGVAARKSVPFSAPLPAVFSAVPGQFTATRWERGDLFTNAPIQVRLLRETAAGGKFGLNLTSTGEFTKPDLLVYWVAGNPKIKDTLPDDAILLGAFQSDRTLPLPAEPGARSGLLVLYALADQEIVATSNPLAIE